MLVSVLCKFNVHFLPWVRFQDRKHGALWFLINIVH